ncbi:MAG: hypothetical protein AAGA28_06745 [Pseudomonadota bacterium]
MTKSTKAAPAAKAYDIANIVKEARYRLEEFSGLTGTVSPTRLLDDNGAPTTELLAYCKAEALNLDWLFCGDARPLLLAYRLACLKGTT